MLFAISAATARQAAGAMTLEHASGRTMIPPGRWPAKAHSPGRADTEWTGYPGGLPGVRVSG
jgi:hypothetical protein